ncbi:MAG: high-potential iron-sulfur protein [Novosphingobium sp.]|nr:high-potential iron-sulfur protein [Novosphingobium sp.]
MNSRRRSILALIGLAPATMLLARSLSAQTVTACYDPASLPHSQKSRRRSLGFIETGPIAARRCGNCIFFTATSASGCGTCQLLNGPVTALSTCNSFAARPEQKQ